MGARLDGMLFCREAERVPTNRMQDVEPFRALVTGEDVGRSVTLWMTNMQTRARRIREHVEDIEFLPRRVVLRAERTILLPECLPVRLYVMEVVVCALGSHLLNPPL